MEKSYHKQHGLLRIRNVLFYIVIYRMVNLTVSLKNAVNQPCERHVRVWKQSEIEKPLSFDMQHLYILAARY